MFYLMRLKRNSLVSDEHPAVLGMFLFIFGSAIADLYKFVFCSSGMYFEFGIWTLLLAERGINLFKK